MRSRVIVSLWLGILCMGTSAFCGGFICDVPPGTDFFTDSEGVGEIPGLGIFAACGPTMIVRGAPDNPTGPCTIPTEIVSMTLMGIFDPCGASLPILITEDPDSASVGYVASDATGGLPATSCFDVHTIVTIDAMPPIKYKVAAMCADSPGAPGYLEHFPPGAATPGGPPCIRLGEDPYKKGFPRHRHDPCPPKVCCQLPCGIRLHLSCQACQEFFGEIGAHCDEQGDCPFLCASQSVNSRAWGQVKRLYRD